MDKLQPPDSLPLAGNLSDNWRRWKQRFELYMIASGNQSKPDETKSAILLHIVGQEALEIYNTFAWESAGDNKKVDKIMEKFEAYCNPRKNITWERHVFNTNVNNLANQSTSTSQTCVAKLDHANLGPSQTASFETASYVVS